jgi:hypothetical protein
MVYEYRCEEVIHHFLVWTQIPMKYVLSPPVKNIIRFIMVISDFRTQCFSDECIEALCSVESIQLGAKSSDKG